MLKQKNKLKPYMSISIDAEKALDKIHHLLLIKTFVTRNGRVLPQSDKGYLLKKKKNNNPIAYIRLKEERVNALLLRSAIRQGCLLSPLLFNTALKVLASIIRQEEEMKGIQILKEEVKLSLLTI